MPKKVFWPVALVVMGLIIIASNFGVLPATFGDLWPIILVIVGLGGLITSDRDEWLVEDRKSAKKAPAKKTAKPVAKKQVSKRKATKKK